MEKTAKADPVIAELHAVRDDHAARLGHGIGAIIEDIRATQKALGRECVRLPARRIVAGARRSAAAAPGQGCLVEAGSRLSDEM